MLQLKIKISKVYLLYVLYAIVLSNMPFLNSLWVHLMNCVVTQC